MRTMYALLQASPEALFASPTEPSLKMNGTSESAEDLAYGQPPKVDAASKLVRTVVVPKLVADTFKSSEKALKGRWVPPLLLHFVQLTKAMIDREVPTLNEVDSRAWLAAVLRCLERVSRYQQHL